MEWYKDTITLLQRALEWVATHGLGATSVSIGEIVSVAVYTGKRFLPGSYGDSTPSESVDIGFLLVNGEPEGLNRIFFSSRLSGLEAGDQSEEENHRIKGEYIRAVRGQFVQGTRVIPFVITPEFVCSLHLEHPNQ